MVSRERSTELVVRAQSVKVVSDTVKETPMKNSKSPSRRRFVIFARTCAFSQLGWILAGFHAVWFYLGIQSMGPPSRSAGDFLDSLQGADWTLLAGRPFHYHYQSWLLKSLIWADLPSILAGSLCDLVLSPLHFVRHVGTYEASYIGAGILFGFATGQWVIIGHLLQRRFWPTSD
jgi:hypothetical protein